MEGRPIYTAPVKASCWQAQRDCNREAVMEGEEISGDGFRLAYVQQASELGVQASCLQVQIKLATQPGGKVAADASHSCQRCEVL